MKNIFLSFMLLSFSITTLAQNNQYPHNDNPIIYHDSPSIILQRNTNIGGFTQGIQTKFNDGTNNWYFGALQSGNFIVSKGDYSNPLFSVSLNGNVGIGTINPDNNQGWGKVLDIYAIENAKLLVRSSEIKTGIFSDPTWGSHLMGRVGTESFHDLGLMAGYGNIIMQLKTNGNVGIGTSTPNEKLSVNGNIRAKEIKIEVINWPDYVFEHDYKRSSLFEIEKFINMNKRLPEMPSAKSLEIEGLSVAEMFKLQQKKIEELTLHLIDQQKEINKLKKKLSGTKK